MKPMVFPNSGAETLAGSCFLLFFTIVHVKTNVFSFVSSIVSSIVGSIVSWFVSWFVS